jgi:broad specificity phosphatase PhoE
LRDAGSWAGEPTFDDPPTTGREFHPTPKERRLIYLLRAYRSERDDRATDRARYRGHVLTILLTRHGHTSRSEPEQYLGQSVHAGLTERGRADAQKLADRLRDVPIDRVVSSPLGRATETSEILARGHVPQLKVETDQRLTELDYGRWEGMLLEDILVQFPGAYEEYDADPSTYHVGGGENGAEVAVRVESLMSDLLAWQESEAEDRTCLMVGHSSVNRVLLAVVMGVPLIDYRRRFQQDWVNLTVLRWHDRAAGPLLLLGNDLSHVHGVGGVTWA